MEQSKNKTQRMSSQDAGVMQCSVLQSGFVLKMDMEMIDRYLGC